MVQSSPSFILQFRHHGPGPCDVPRLRSFVSAAEQNDQYMSALNKNRLYIQAHDRPVTPRHLLRQASHRPSARLLGSHSPALGSSAAASVPGCVPSSTAAGGNFEGGGGRGF